MHRYVISTVEAKLSVSGGVMLWIYLTHTQKTPSAGPFTSAQNPNQNNKSPKTGVASCS